jgi:hypothetical protein
MYASCASSQSSNCWLFSEGLASTSLVGNPREWFNFLEEQQHHAYSGACIAPPMQPIALDVSMRVSSTNFFFPNYLNWEQ